VQRAVALVVIVLVAYGCRRERKEPVEVKTRDEIDQAAKDVLDPKGLYISNTAETDARVQKAFPKGVASEDARATIGSAPPPPENDAPDPTADIVVEIELAPSAALAAVRAAVKPRPEGAATFVKGMLADGKWQYAEDQNATGPYTRVAVEISFIDIDAPVSEPLVERQITWARRALGHLGQRAPTVSMTSARALATATAAFKLKHTLTDDAIDVGVVIVAPKGKKFAGRLVWDVVYSAGFHWGDGDYFHWVPSPHTDVSQGIGMGTSTGASYFMPEWVAKNDGSADIDDLEMSFNVARTWKPEAVFDVMVRAAKYMARRLGGTLVGHDGKPFDEAAARARVSSIAQSMGAAGLVPGSGLALQVF
jgi:hypothetical protein